MSSQQPQDTIRNANGAAAASPLPYHHHSSFDNHEIDNKSNKPTADGDDAAGEFSFDHILLNNMMTTAVNTSTQREIERREIMEITEEFESSGRAANTGGGQWRSAISEGGYGIQTTSLFSIDINKIRSSSASSEVDVVYVAVGKSDSSLDALLWTLNNAIIPGRTLLYLVHIFSEIKLIPSPLGGGWVPKNQVSRDLVERYTSKETSNRRELLNKYVDQCNAHLVQVETILIESDSVANAIVELISVLNIRRLILGISKTNFRKVGGRKWNGSTVADQLLQSAPEECQVKIICQGKDVSTELEHQSLGSAFISNTNSKSASSDQLPQQQPPGNTSFPCCFGGNQTLD